MAPVVSGEWHPPYFAIRGSSNCSSECDKGFGRRVARIALLTWVGKDGGGFYVGILEFWKHLHGVIQSFQGNSVSLAATPN